MFVHPADLAAGPGHAARVGVDLELRAVRFAEIRDRIFGRIDPISEGGLKWRASNENVTVFQEAARFLDPHTLRVGEGTITADRVVLAAGSRPVIPDLPGLDTVRYHTSDTVMRLPELPRSMVVIGGGYIGAEFEPRLLLLRHRGHRRAPRRPDAARGGRRGLRALHRAARPAAGRAHADGRRGGAPGTGRGGRDPDAVGSRGHPGADGGGAAGGHRAGAERRHARPGGGRRRAGRGRLRRRRRPPADHRRATSGRWATSPSRASSSTSPTTRRGWSSTTCCTPTPRWRATTASSRTPSSPTPRSRRWG